MAEVADKGVVHPKAVMWNEEMEKSHCQLGDGSRQRGRQNWLNRQELVHGKLRSGESSFVSFRGPQTNPGHCDTNC